MPSVSSIKNDLGDMMNEQGKKESGRKLNE